MLTEVDFLGDFTMFNKTMLNKTMVTAMVVLLVFGVSFFTLHIPQSDQKLTSKEISACKSLYNRLMSNPIERVLTLKQTVHKVRKGACIVKVYTILGLPFSIVELNFGSSEYVSNISSLN